MGCTSYVVTMVAPGTFSTIWTHRGVDIRNSTDINFETSVGLWTFNSITG